MLLFTCSLESSLVAAGYHVGGLLEKSLARAILAQYCNTARLLEKGEDPAGGGGGMRAFAGLKGGAADLVPLSTHLCSNNSLRLGSVQQKILDHVFSSSQFPAVHTQMYKCLYPENMVVLDIVSLEG